MTRILLAGLCMLALCQCSSTPGYVADSSLNTNNAAKLIVYTPNTAFNQQNFIKPTISIDGKTLGKVSISEPLNALLTPGTHTIRFQRSFPIMPSYESGTIEINARANTTYYIRYSFDFDDRSVAPGEQAPTSGASSFRVVAKSTAEDGL